MDLHVLGQDAVVQLAGLGLDPLQHVLRLLAGAHEDDAFHRVVLGLEAEFAEPGGDADLDAADVLDQHRRAVVDRQHDVADVLGRLDQAFAAHVVELAALGIEAAAGVAVVGRQGGLDLGHGQADAGDADGVEQHLVLHLAAAEAGVVGHPGHGAELRLDHPVLDGLQLHRRAVGALKHISIDQPRGRRLGRDIRRHPAGQTDARHQVEHALAGEVVAGAVAEGDGDVRQAVERDRPDAGFLGNAVHSVLDRHGDLALDLLGRVARPLGDRRRWSR